MKTYALTNPAYLAIGILCAVMMTVNGVQGHILMFLAHNVLMFAWITLAFTKVGDK